MTKKALGYRLQTIVVKLSFILFLLLIPLLPIASYLPPAYAAGASLSLSPATGTFNKGCSFSLEIKVDTGGAQTDGTDAILFYDTTRFTATQIRNGTIYPDFPGNSIDPQAGKLTVSGLASVATPFVGAGTLATVDFTVTETAPAGATQIKFDFDPSNKAKTTDSNVVERTTVADILNQVTNANLTVGTGSCGGSLTPTVFPTKTPIGGTGENTSKKKIIPPVDEELSKTADFQTTWMVAAVGGVLTVVGILGLAFL